MQSDLVNDIVRYTTTMKNELGNLVRVGVSYNDKAFPNSIQIVFEGVDAAFENLITPQEAVELHKLLGYILNDVEWEDEQSK